MVAHSGDHRQGRVRAGGCEWLPDGTRIQYARCWECICDQCPGGPHGWADQDDIGHALATGQPDPSNQSCGCVCVEGDPITHPTQDFERDWDEDLELGTCPVCGAGNACGYDAEGRPLIHAVEESQ